MIERSRETSPGARALTIAGLVVTLTPAAWHIENLRAIFRARFAFPQDIEWMESGHLYHAYRILHQLPIYGDPARGFATFPYPPLYWVVLAACGRLFGLDYWTGRLVSVGSIVLSALVLGAVLYRRAPARWIGAAFAVVAAASIGAGYPSGGGSFDLVRSDAFATLVPIVAAALIGDGRLSTRRAVLASFALAGSIYAKQTGIFFVLWLLVFVLVRGKKTGRLILATTAAICVAVLALLHLATEGWFLVWLFDMRHHGINWDTWADPLGVFLRHAPFLLGVPPLVVFLHRRRWLRPETTKWVGVLGAAVVSSMLAHIKIGGWLNVYTPELVLAWPITLLVVSDLLHGLWPARSRAHAVLWCALGTCAAVLVFLRYDRTPFVPTPRMWSGARTFHETVAKLDGEVVVTTIPFAAVRDGKHCAQPILQGYLDSAYAGMAVSFIDALDRSGAQYVIVTGTAWEEHPPDKLATRFRLARELDVDLDSPMVAHPYPRTLWVRLALPTAPTAPTAPASPQGP